MLKAIVTIEALQKLSSAEAVVQFFQQLGYQILRNFALPVNQLFPTPELQVHVKRVWGIAQYQPLLYVYLLEVDSLNNTLIKQLCRVIARRQGNYLLVFTKDYSELAFVNLVRSTSQESGRSVELRRLDIDRANPTQKAVRILRRIVVADAQMPTPLLAVKLYKKHCEAFELTKWRNDEFNNRSLFSDYYLKERLPDEPSQYPEWRQDIMSIYQKARNLYQSLDFDTLQRDEHSTQEKWVRPILYMLGHSNIEQSKDDAHPTFRLFSDSDYDSERASPVLCHVKAWGHYLDHYGQQEQLKIEQPLNPSFQIIRFLSEYRADWGILTNGREWRLYYTKAHATASNYYEIDLVELLESNDIESFRYFYHFFCQQAFLFKPERKSFLEKVYDSSQDYAIKLAERIKGLVFERIFPSLAEGFVAYRKQEKKVTQETDDSLKLIFASSLTLLYRMLFLLYAEDRDLLPVGEQYGYRLYSLKALKEDVVKALEANQTYSRMTYRLWNELASLFNMIAKGDKDLNVPTYNGGLFSGDNPRNIFLAEHKIADYWLATALDLLTSDIDPDTGRKGFIDYKSLGVNQLGSIYEGLLEFHLRIADEESEGEIYLENDKRERKATGSYYTPDYIVKYIVENTIGPVLEEKFKKVEELFATQMDTNAIEHPAVSELFSLKVLDPAMGSGHFLVEAVDFITEKMIAFLAKYPTNPVIGELERIRTTIRKEMESQGVMIDDSQLTDANLLKRRVMKSCIYGVDLNDMAVELSKLSLWLDAFTLGAPLSFLDHHLKCGNSLIGVTDIKEYIIPNTTRYQDFLQAVGELVHVSQLTDATMTEVDESSELYVQAKERIRPTIERANVEVTKYFMDISKESVTNAGTWAYKPPDKRIATDDISRVSLSNFNATQQVAQNKYFFHWRLEFPEVFYTAKGDKQNPGFDTVIGNPPYVRSRNINELERKYYSYRYKSSYRTFDIYIPFLEICFLLSRINGAFSLIIPHSYLSQPYAKINREFLLKQCKLISIVDLYELVVFKDAMIKNCIPIFFKKGKDFDKNEVVHIILAKNSELTKAQAIFIPQVTFLSNPNFMIRTESTKESAKLSDKILRNSVALGKIVYISKGVEVYVRGSGRTKEDFISYNNDILNPKRYLEGKEIGRYSIEYWGRFLSYQPEVHCSGKFPELFENEKIIMKRILGEQGLIATYDNEYFYVENTLICCVLKKDLISVKGLNFIDEEITISQKYYLKFLLSILNSSLLTYYFKDKLSDKLQIYVGALSQLPIRCIDFTSSSEKVQHDELSALAEKMIEMNQQKQAEVNRYIKWLEGTADDEINNLTGKTTLQSYYNHSWDDVLKVLIKNKSKLSINPTLPLMQNMLEDEYRRSMEILEPLMRRISATDELIDQIVYRLYGLTEEEIQIVEEATKGDK